MPTRTHPTWTAPHTPHKPGSCVMLRAERDAGLRAWRSAPSFVVNGRPIVIDAQGERELKRLGIIKPEPCEVE